MYYVQYFKIQGYLNLLIFAARVRDLPKSYWMLFPPKGCCLLGCAMMSINTWHACVTINKPLDYVHLKWCSEGTVCWFWKWEEPSSLSYSITVPTTVLKNPFKRRIITLKWLGHIKVHFIFPSALSWTKCLITSQRKVGIITFWVSYAWHLTWPHKPSRPHPIPKAGSRCAWYQINNDAALGVWLASWLDMDITVHVLMMLNNYTSWNSLSLRNEKGYMNQVHSLGNFLRLWVTNLQGSPEMHPLTGFC